MKEFLLLVWYSKQLSILILGSNFTSQKPIPSLNISTSTETLINGTKTPSDPMQTTPTATSIPESKFYCLI